ncbi:MAG: retropepsin-like aspartic protease [Phycisphaerae bacterium]
MPNYDGLHYNPPAPVVHVTLREISSGALLPNVPLLIDTGADTTLLPKNALQRLGVQSLPNQHYQLLGFDGASSVAEAVDLDMIFLNKAYRGRYLVIDTEHGILGRDVLAGVALVLDGPQQIWSERPPSP